MGFLTGGSGNWGSESPNAATPGLSNIMGLAIPDVPLASSTKGFDKPSGSKAKKVLEQPQPQDFYNPAGPMGVDVPEAPPSQQVLAVAQQVANRDTQPGEKKPISRREFAMLLGLADKSGNLDEFKYFAEQGFLNTPGDMLVQEAQAAKARDAALKNQREDAELGLKAMEYERKVGESERDYGLRVKEYERKVAESDRDYGLQSKSLGLRQQEFKAKFDQAQLDIREQKFKQAKAMEWMQGGKMEAGIALMSGEPKEAFKLAFPNLYKESGQFKYKNKIEMMQGAMGGDSEAAEMLEGLRAYEQTSSMAFNVSRDGEVSFTQGKGAQVPLYPAKEYLADRDKVQDIKSSLDSISQLESIIQTNPAATGPAGPAQQFWSGIAGWASKVVPGKLGKQLEEVSKDPSALAAAKYDALGEALTYTYARGEMNKTGVLTDQDREAAERALGTGRGWLTGLSPEVQLQKLNVAKERLLQSQKNVASRRADFEKNAPHRYPEKMRTTWDDIYEKATGKKIEPEAPAPAPSEAPAPAPSEAPAPAPSEAPAPDPAAIQKQIDSMTPEQKQQRYNQLKRYQELLQKQQGR
jgi:hypothetical protein